MKTMLFCLQNASLTTEPVLLELHKTEIPIQTGLGVHPASCTMGTGSFLGVKRPGSGVDHLPPSSADVKERVQLHLFSPSGPLWPVLGWPLPLLYAWDTPYTASNTTTLSHNAKMLSPLLPFSFFFLCRAQFVSTPHNIRLITMPIPCSRIFTFTQAFVLLSLYLSLILATLLHTGKHALSHSCRCNNVRCNGMYGNTVIFGYSQLPATSPHTPPHSIPW